MQNLQFKMIDRYAVSPLGFIVSKRCKECFRPMFSMKGAVYCSKDCKQDYEDWNYLQGYKKALVRQREYEREKKISQKINIGEKMPEIDKRKEYLREYAIKNKEKRRASGLKTRKKYEAKLKLLKVARLKDINK